MSAEMLVHETRQRSLGMTVMAAALGAFAFFGIAISGSLGSTFDTLTKNMPNSLAAFVGANVPGGYVVGEIFTLIAPIALVAYAVLTGAAALAGEERDGTMAMLSAQPVSRSRMLWSKIGGFALSMLVIGVVFWALMALGGQLFDSSLDASKMAAGVVHLVALALAFGAIAFAIGAATGRTDLAAGITGGLAVTAYLTSTMLPIAGFDSWARLSPWHYALGSDPLRNGLSFADLGVFAAIIAVACALAVLAFNRRDLKG